MKILVAGDFCPQKRVAELFSKESYADVLGNVISIVTQSDYSIVNFESCICYGNETPIDKCGPNLKCSSHSMDALKWAGFDCVTLANNHFLDYGKNGVKNTLEACQKYGIDTVGGGMNLQEASKILYKNIEGKILAIINCCEHEFSIATEETAGSNPLNPIQQYYAIKEARTRANYVLVIVHGGHEHYQLPSTRMQELYRFFIDAGADAVVNHHQHCYSGYEYYKTKPIIYGIGNFCFDEGLREKRWHEGYMVMLLFDKEVKIKLYPYSQCVEDACIHIDKPENFDVNIQYLCNIISKSNKLAEEEKKYYKSVMRSSKNVLNPIVNRYLSFLQYHNLFPDIVTEKWLKLVHNHVNCEAHRDKILFYLNHRNEK